MSLPARRACIALARTGLLACALAAAAPAAAATAREAPAGAAVAIAGQVTEPDGTPISKARMTLRVTRANTVACDDSGRFRATLRLPALDALERGPWIAQLDGAARGWRLLHADGEPSLGLELALERGPAGARVVARSNDERLAGLAAAAVAGNTVRALDGVRFLGTGGERSSVPPAPNMPFVARVVVEAREEAAAPPMVAPSAPPAATPEAKAAKPEKSAGPTEVAKPARTSKVPDSTKAAKPARPPAPRSRATDTRADSVRRAQVARADSTRRANAARADSVRRAAARGPRSNVPRAAHPVVPADSGPAPRDARVRAVDPVPAMGPATPPVVPRADAAAPAPPGPLVNPPRAAELPDPQGCACRFAGTVELVPSGVLDRPETIVIRLEEWPAVADTVELYMGAPRPFRLAPVPCGSRRVRVERLDPALPPARIVTGQAMRGFGCASAELVQPRLVIALDRARRR